jgi:glyceraldehyde 3-phosphate dehydrogenase
MSKKIAINGFGRIGRQVFKIINDNYKDLEVVAINDLTDTKTLAHLYKYDSLYGTHEGEVSFTENAISVDGNEIKVFAEKDPEKLPWGDLNIDIVLECTGLFTDSESAGKHLKAGAKKVIISAPGKGDIPGFILGVNEDKYDANNDNIMDLGSCTTNCLTPICKILNDNLGIVKGFMTTVHSYTNDQKILDLPHKDLRRARAAAINIIPTSTGAAKAIGKMIPELKGKLDGIAMRVPTPTVSALDLIVEVKKETTKEEVNEIFKKAEKEKSWKGIFKAVEEELVSSDFKGSSFSSIVDLPLTMVNGNMVKIVGWYDNEWGYSSRLAQFADFISKKL